MRVGIDSSWTTRLLLLVAFVAAGLIAWQRVQDQQTADDARPVEPVGEPVEEPSEVLVEVEIVTPE